MKRWGVIAAGTAITVVIVTLTLRIARDPNPPSRPQGGSSGSPVASSQVPSKDTANGEPVCFDDSNVSVQEGDRRGPLVGGVDGDGVPDRVWTVARRRADGRCRFFLEVVAGSGRRYEKRLPGRDLASFQYPMFLTPVVLAPIDQRGGLEIGVLPYKGIAVENVALFTIRRGSLVRMGIDGDRTNAFRYSGSISGFGGVDCVRPKSGEVVATWASHDRVPYDVTRSYYRVEGTDFVLVETEEYRLLSDEITEEHFPEIAHVAFPSCGVVHG